MLRAIESGCMSTELTEDGGAPNASLRQLPAPGTIATGDLAAKLALQGTTAAGGSPDEFKELIVNELRNWKEAAQRANIKVE